MKSTQWVQHISGQGEKWKVDSEWSADKGTFWLVDVGLGQSASLPKSEYVLCTPPERWEDVTGECSIFGDVRRECLGISHGRPPFYTDPILEWSKLNLIHREPGWALGYRLRKVRYADCSQHGTENYRYRNAFIVEKRVNP